MSSRRPSPLGVLYRSSSTLSASASASSSPATTATTTTTTSAEAAITTSSVFRSWRWLSRYPFGKISWPIPFDYRTLLLRCCCYCSPDWRTSGLTDWRHSPGRALFSGLRSSINCLARKSIIDIGFALMIIAANWVSGVCDGAHCLWHCLTCSASLLTLPLSSSLCLSFYLSDLPAP